VYELYAWFRERGYDFVYTMVTESDGYYRTGEIDVRRREDELQRKLHNFYGYLIDREPNPGKRLLFRDFRDMLDGKSQKRACPMLRDTVSIDPKGNIVPCVQAYERKFGNVRDAGPAAAWRGPTALRTIDALRREKCPTCTAACGVSYTAVAREELLTRGRRLLRAA
jgi:MoaA/NifB/PqqE/SkfB family radical SAM enzyme